jgi:hypothetical protein
MARVGQKECYPFACVPVACGRRPVIVPVFQLYCGSDEVPWTPSHRQKRGKLVALRLVLRQGSPGQEHTTVVENKQKYWACGRNAVCGRTMLRTI